MQKGVINGFKAILANEAKFAASNARRIPGKTTIMNNAVYSPCKICEEDPPHEPLWQLRAKKIIHNKDSQTINYQNVILEIRGFPILYTPFFSHPDSSVNRKTGFLVPTQGQSSQLGTTINIPLYVTFSENTDATLDTKFTSKEGIVLGGEYRHKTSNGYYEFNGSITRPEDRDDNNNVISGKRKIRNHLFANGKFIWDENWSWGFNGGVTSDDTYLKRYRIDATDTLSNNIYVEGINGKNYASSNIFFFQGLRADDDPGEAPIIFPHIQHKYMSDPNDRGIFFNLNSNFLHLTRKEGVDSSRLSFRGGWHLPTTSNLGDQLMLSMEFKADSYLTNDINDINNQNNKISNKFITRLIPQLSGSWRWPFVKNEKKSQQVIEPIIAFAVSPYGGNPRAIPNEDSQSFEFDDTNLFSANRFPGLDRIEGGPRVNVGIKYGIYGDKTGSINALLGQVFRLKSDNTFAEGTGIEERKSDYVGRISLSPTSTINYYQRVRLDRDTLSLRRNEIAVDLSPSKYRINLTYLSLSRELTADELIDREEVAATAKVKITKFWSLTGHTRHDLTNDGGTINTGTGIEYDDECFSFIFDFERNFTRDRDLQPDTSVTFRVRLKNLG
ncbi:LPS assembly protein LptD [Alphaproteobacteria bacterium]|nr:LPS assembly protein LptD [Alphaproteobacteria bacterium]